MSAIEIQFIEEFVLAEDRATVLKKLIPGTDDYYYFHGLHYQHSADDAAYKGNMAKWEARLKQERRSEPSAMRELRNRQALLNFDDDPKAGWERIIRDLDLKFNHTRRVSQQPNYKTELDQKLIATSAYMKRWSDHSSYINRFTPVGIDLLQGAKLSADQRRALLHRLERPDWPGLVELIDLDLNFKNSRGFGSHPIHSKLTLSQLQALAKKQPALLNNAAFVNEHIKRLSPGSDVDLTANLDLRVASLDKIWDFVKALNPVHNSLKLNVLYERLRLDLQRGDLDEARFLEYVKIPRNLGYMEPRWLKLEKHRNRFANLNQQFPSACLSPVRGDEGLLREILERFFIEAADYKKYSPYLRDSFLKEIFASTKILHGKGDVERWASMLSPAVYRAIKESVEINFRPENKQHFAGADPVKLAVDIKNISEMLVKVYEVNGFNYFRENGQPVNLAINLDGLVATSEEAKSFDHSPERRVTETFKFPQLKGRGIWVVEFIGNGFSSRALVQKGRLNVQTRSTAGGHGFLVFDEAGKPAKKATAWIGGREFSPTKDGVIFVPYSTSPSTETLILRDGDFASIASFPHKAETYKLACGIHVDHEALQHEGEAEIVVRPVLTLNGVPVNPSLLQHPRLVMNATDLRGTSSQREFGDLELKIDEELVIPFKVPRDLVSLSVTLQGSVENISANREDSLSDSANFQLNGIDAGTELEAIGFVRLGNEHLVEVRGRNGEVVASRPLRISVQHKGFTDDMDFTLQTDEKGVANLGALAGIDWVQVRGAGLRDRRLLPDETEMELPDSIHGVVDEPVPVALPVRDLADLSLFSLREGEYQTDLHDKLKLDRGYVMIPALPGGDYELTIKSLARRIPVRITSGEFRRLEFVNPTPLQISAIAAKGETVKVQLGNPGKNARVHVFATWYQPAWSPFENLLASQVPGQTVQPLPAARSFYESGRDIGEEYRYILDRQTRPHYPGNMLTRPGLLLNPWEVRVTTATDQDAKEGDEYELMQEELMEVEEAEEQETLRQYGGSTRSRYAKGRIAGEVAGGVHADINYLAEPSVRLLNLKPDKDGVVTINIADLKGKPQLHIVAVNPLGTVSQPFFLDAGVIELEDLRLRRGLDPNSGFAEQKLVSTLAGDGRDVIIRDGRTAQFELYDSLGQVFGLLQTLSGNNTMDEFRFVLDWPDLKDEDKRAKYSEFACHELSFFLYHKDRPFFDKVIKPYLVHKKDKTFMDHYLLGAPLENYTEPWAYDRLNHLEKILLAGRLPGRRDGTARWIKERSDMLPPDIEGDNARFLTAIKTTALGGGDQGLAAVTASLRVSDADEDRTVVAKSKKRQAYFGKDAARKEVRGRADMDDMVRAVEFAAPGAAAATPAPVELALMEAKMSSGVLSDEIAVDGLVMGGAIVDRLSDLQSSLSIDENLGDLRKLARDESRRFFVKLEQTKEYAENNYWKRPIGQQLANLVPIHSFWNDYAAHVATGEKGPFLSRHLTRPTGNFAEIMLALAVLDLPFEGGALDKAEVKDGDVVLNLKKPAILFHKEIRNAEEAEDKTPILVAQNFFRADDRYRNENNERFDKFVRVEFLRGVVYGCQVILSNPNSSRQKLDAMLQIPRGAVQVQNGFQTRGFHVVLEPFATRTLEYYFYFPTSGDFAHFPVNVARNESLVARAEPLSFKVVDAPTDVDETSWAWISQHAEPDAVLAHLDKANLNRINLDEIAWRMRDKAFFDKAMKLLGDRYFYHHTSWQYAVLHRDVTRAGSYLKHTSFPDRCGLWIDTPILEIDPVARHRYEHLEYDPLVNKRAHQLGRTRHIANHALHGQYHGLLQVLSYRPKFDDTDHLALSYYLALQDRIGEALDYFAKVDRNAVTTQMQYDYMAAWLAISQEDLDAARGFAAPYEKHPVDKWRKPFVSLLNQLDEKIEIADEKDRDETQDLLATTEPVMHVSVVDRDVKIDHQNLSGAVVNLYPMDIELLFSRNPFVKDQSATFTFVKPAFTQQLPFAEAENQTRFAIPQQYRNRNLMVELVAGGVKDAAAVYANDITVNPIENYGQLQVLHQDTSKALSKTYVKVYARMAGGQVKFFKDGYTDFRGRFDYVSLNSNDLNQVERFSILVLHDEFGATILETEPPKR